MSERPSECFYTSSHEWIKKDGELYLVGISDYAQEELGDVVFIDLPEVGKAIKKAESIFTVESVKAVSDIYAPVDGEIVEVNANLSNAPELINESPFNDGWMIKIRVTDENSLSELMDLSRYNALVSELSK